MNYIAQFTTKLTSGASTQLSHNERKLIAQKRLAYLDKHQSSRSIIVKKDFGNRNMDKKYEEYIKDIRS